MLFLALLALIWFGGRLAGYDRGRYAGMVGLWLAIVLVQAVLGPDHPLARLFGGTLQNWLVLGLCAVLAAGYVLGLRKLRHRADPKPDAAATHSATDGPFSGAELSRYARHIMLREIGGPGQQRLKSARVLVVGAGGLGSPALMYLAAAGVGTIGVIDDDSVDASNLQRQIIHSTDTLSLPKVQSAVQAMAAINPHITLRPYHRRLTPDIAADLIADYDLVLDGCDNFDTRYLVNQTCVALGKPLISAAMTQWEGQISLYHPASGTPCYECVFPTRPAAGMVPSCAEAGVVAPLPGVIGSLMAVEAVKHITGAGQTLTGRLMIHDALYAETRVITVKPRPDCPVCGGH